MLEHGELYEAWKELGRFDYDVNLATAWKERSWARKTDAERAKLEAKACAHWDLWLSHGAIEELDEAVSRDTERMLHAVVRGEGILVPRFLFTYKNGGKRTSSNDFPEDAGARLIIPGFKDASFHRGELRADARQALEILNISSSALQAVNLIGFLVPRVFDPPSPRADPYISRSLFMSCPRSGPNVPGIRPNRLYRVLKGVLGLRDAPRDVYKRLVRAMNEHGCIISFVDGSTLYFWFSGKLHGTVVGYVDDLLFTGDRLDYDNSMRLGENIKFCSSELNDLLVREADQATSDIQ